MTLVRKVLARGQLPNTAGDLYIPTSGYKGLPHAIRLFNTGSSAETIKLYDYDGTTQRQLHQFSLAAKERVELPFIGEGDVFEPGNALRGETTTAATVNYKVTGTEETVDSYLSTRSLDFGGTNEYVFCGDAWSYEYNVPFSIFGWLKCSSAAAHQCLISRSAAAGDKGWSLQLNLTGGQLRMALVSSAATYTIVLGSTNVCDGSWHSFGMVYTGSGDASGVSLFVDDAGETESVVSDTRSGTIITSAGGCLGIRGSSQVPYTGKLDEVSVYTVALTTDQITELHNGGAPGNVEGYTSFPNCTTWFTCGDRQDKFPCINNYGSDIISGYMVNMETADISTDVP